MSRSEPGVFAPDRIDDLVSFFEGNGYATLRGVFDEPELAAAEDELAAAQRLLVEGRLDARHGTVILDEPDATIDGRPFAHYVCFATAASPRADRLVHHPTLVGDRQAPPRPAGLAPRLRAVRRGLPGRPARPGLGLLTHRMAHRPPVRSPPGHLAGRRLHHPLRPHLAGQRLPPRAARQPPRRHRGHPTRLRAGPGRDRPVPGAGRRPLPPRRPLARRGPGHGRRTGGRPAPSAGQLARRAPGWRSGTGPTTS